MALGAPGWARFPAERATLDWAAAARPAAEAALRDPAFADMHQCEGTWFVGLDALPNDAAGRVAGGPALTGAAVEAARALAGWPSLHRAQVSVTWPGYPRPRAGEGEGAFRYRQRRDAAHVDGVLGVGTPKRRFVSEPHLWILGIALTDGAEDAAPLSVWEGSHALMRETFRAALAPADAPGEVDVTEAYTACRARCFEACRRVNLPLKTGEAVLLHPLLLHGVAPWTAPEGPPRMIAYFRPPAASVEEWLAI
ncbi:MAG: phytanoyl-CoA dioxygenase family protein [Pseudomonadota bacterium]